MIDKIKDFKESLSERVKSPFVGSFIISWSLIHWKIFALFFYTEDRITIQQRIDKIDAYLSTENCCSLIWHPIVITLVVIFSYNALNALALVFKLSYDNWASPYIQKWLYNENIIEKVKYEKIKREFSTIKKNYDEDKDKFINSEKERRELENNFENYRRSSFQGQSLSDITQIFSKNIKWENVHEYPDGTIGSEQFTCSKDGFILSDGKELKIDNIKISSDGNILSFDKTIDEKILKNYLIRDKEGNCHGVENNNIIITYRKEKTIIHYARYGVVGHFVDITTKISSLVANNILEFPVNNSLVEGNDPIVGKVKTLEISYTKNGIKKQISAMEGAKAKIE